MLSELSYSLQTGPEHSRNHPLIANRCDRHSLCISIFFPRKSSSASGGGIWFTVGDRKSGDHSDRCAARRRQQAAGQPQLCVNGCSTLAPAPKLRPGVSECIRR